MFLCCVVEGVCRIVIISLRIKKLFCVPVSKLFTIVADLGFFVDNMLQPNNSMTVSSESFIILHCVTNLTTCCTEEDGGVAGEWFLPGQVQPVGAFSGGYITYGVPSAVVLENNGRGVWPSGIYTCRIPDESAQLRTIYIGVDTGTVCHVTCM